MPTLTPCLWFDTKAEEAANYYCDIFRNSRILRTERYTEAGHEVHHKPAGSVMVSPEEYTPTVAQSASEWVSVPSRTIPYTVPGW